MLAELIASAVTLAASPGTTLPGTAVIGQSEVPWPIGGGMMDFGVKTTSDSYTDGHFSITAPIFSSIGQDGALGGSLVFIEPYISWGEQGEVATSLGLGFRHLFNRQPLSDLQQRQTGLLDEGLMIGGNLFLDMLDTQSDNRFWQLGFGLEFETRYFALRGNYYHPLTDRQEGEPILQRDIQRATFLTSGEEPFATGHTIQQDVTFTTYDFYTDRLYRTYEEGMKGWDVEAAVMVPWLDKWCELWLVGGYGDFQNQPFGPQIAGTGELHGWKAGVEFRPIPQLVLSATHYEEQRMAGGEWVYGLSLQLPLDPEPHNPCKSWWRKVKDTLKPRSRHLAERAAVPVHRQNAAVKVANSISEPEVTQYAKVVSEEEKRVVVRDDVIFVNNGGAQGNGIAAHGAVEDGTAERPFDTLKEGVDLAATPAYQSHGVPTVYAQGGGAAYDLTNVFYDGTNELLLPSGIHLASGGYGIQAFAGKRFGLGVLGVIQPTGNLLSIGGAIGINQSREISVDGFSFQNTLIITAQRAAFRGNRVIGNVGIEGYDVEIRDNFVFGALGATSTLSAVHQRSDGPTTAVFGGNVVVGNGSTNVTLSGYSTVTFTNNHITWLVPSFGGSPGVPLTAVEFTNCAVVSLGGNQVSVKGSRSDLPGIAIFGFGHPFFTPTHTQVISLGGNLATGAAFSSNVFSIYVSGSLSGALSINGSELNLDSGGILLGRLW